MVSKPLYYLFIVLLLTCCGQTISQNNEGDKIFGFTLSPLIPIDYFGAGPLILENNYSNIELSSKIGYQFGMLMRNTKSKNITLESGILFCRRNFKFIGENNFIGSNGGFFCDTSFFSDSVSCTVSFYLFTFCVTCD